MSCLRNLTSVFENSRLTMLLILHAVSDAQLSQRAPFYSSGQFFLKSSRPHFHFYDTSAITLPPLPFRSALSGVCTCFSGCSLGCFPITSSSSCSQLSLIWLWVKISVPHFSVESNPFTGQELLGILAQQNTSEIGGFLFHP